MKLYFSRFSKEGANTKLPTEIPLLYTIINVNNIN